MYYPWAPWCYATLVELLVTRAASLRRSGHFLILVLLVLLSLASQTTLSEDLLDDILGADDIASSLDHHASVDLDLDGTRASLLVNHGDTALSRAVLLNSMDDSLGNGIGLVSGARADAHEVVVLGDVERGADAEADGRALLGRVFHLVHVAGEDGGVKRLRVEDLRRVGHVLDLS